MDLPTVQYYTSIQYIRYRGLWTVLYIPKICIAHRHEIICSYTGVLCNIALNAHVQHLTELAVARATWGERRHPHMIQSQTSTKVQPLRPKASVGNAMVDKAVHLADTIDTEWSLSTHLASASNLWMDTTSNQTFICTHTEECMQLLGNRGIAQCWECHRSGYVGLMTHARTSCCGVPYAKLDSTKGQPLSTWLVERLQMYSNAIRAIICIYNIYIYIYI